MDYHIVHNEGLNRMNSRVNESGTLNSSLSNKDITDPGLDARSSLMKEEPGNKDITNPGIHTRSSLTKKEPGNKDLTNPGIHAGVNIIPQPMGFSPAFISNGIHQDLAPLCLGHRNIRAKAHR